MIYLTRARLMLESERTVRQRASSDDEEIPKRVCSQLLADPPRYLLWHVRHENQMNLVAAARLRERQIMTLRAVAIEQIHRAALVRYLRDHRVTGAARDQTLREFYGVVDARDSAIMEHRSYLLAASTQLCTADILEMVGDKHGVELVRRYELAYTQYFAMFCDQARARQTGKAYMLEMLLPEVRDTAERLRRKITDPRGVAAPPSTLRRSGVAPPSEALDPRPQIQLLSPGRSRLTM